MSLSESYSDLSAGPPRDEPPPGPPVPASPQGPASPPGPGIDPIVPRLRDALHGVLAIAGEQSAEQRGVGQVYIFRGSLLVPPEDAYRTITERFKTLGYSSMLQRDHDEDAVIAVEGDIPQRRFNSPWWLHLLLLVITVITTTVMGAALTGIPTDRTLDALREWDTAILWPALRDGLPFSLTLLAILGVHEMGHYVAARLHGVKVTLPFFIPLPLPNSLGTMGAVIFIKSPLMNRRQLFDVGLAGPLAGLVLAIPLYVIGLGAEQTVGLPTEWIRAGITRVSNPVLLETLARLFTDVDPDKLDRFVLYGHPMALAAWFGVLLTGLNLLPLGQFDGGHVAYALFGRRAWPVAQTTFGLLVLLALTGGWIAWMVWAFMGLFTGLRHPPPHDDLTPLGRARTVIGLVTILVFFLVIVPVPFYRG
ncbi:MAG: site-2 protease family protein [Anaerolineae bacterium]|nr:site-2 protease family protein [Anaerolineae bacterium]